MRAVAGFRGSFVVGFCCQLYENVFEVVKAGEGAEFFERTFGDEFAFADDDCVRAEGARRGP
jgi:hypothetical protein